MFVSYWFQVVQGTIELESLTLNKELKNLGHPVGNITRAFAGLAGSPAPGDSNEKDRI